MLHTHARWEEDTPRSETRKLKFPITGDEIASWRDYMSC